MSQPKWTEDRTAQLVSLVGDASPVTQETVATVAEELGNSTRSISSKLRKMDYDVELVSAGNVSAFTETESETLSAFVTGNSGVYTYAQVAQAFAEGKFNPKQIQGKILSMELTGHVAPAPKPVTERTYTPEEEAVIVKMSKAGSFMEAIAEAVGKEINSVRGKALSLLKAGEIDYIPKQEHTKSANKSDALSDLGDVTELTVAEIAEKLGKTERGIKVALTRRGLVAVDHDGAARKAKAEEAKAKAA